MAWSAYGFNRSENKVANITTLSIGSVEIVLPQVFPNMDWDNTVKPKWVANSATIDLYYGAQPTNTQAGYTVVYPVFPTSAAATTVQESYNNWLQTQNFSQGPPHSPLRSCLGGDLHAMTQACSTDIDDASLVSAQGADTVPDVNSLYGSLSLSPASVTLPIPGDKIETSFSAICGHGNRDATQDSQQLSRERYIGIRDAMLDNTDSTLLVAPVPNTGPHGIDIPWATGKGSLLASIAKQFTSTQSQFAPVLAKMQAAPGYDPVHAFKLLAGPTLKQSMLGIQDTHVPAQQFVNQHEAVTKGHSGSDAAHNVVKVVKGAGKAVKFGVDTAKKIGGFMEAFI